MCVQIHLVPVLRLHSFTACSIKANIKAKLSRGAAPSGGGPGTLLRPATCQRVLARRWTVPTPANEGKRQKEVRTERGRRRPRALRGGAYSVLATELLGRPPKKPRTSVLDVFFRRRSAASLRPNSQEPALTRVRSRPAGGAPRSSSSEGDGCSLPGGQTELALARRQRRANGVVPPLEHRGRSR